MLNTSTKFHGNTSDSLNVIDGTSGYNCQLKITKEHNSMKNVGRDIVLVLCTFSDDGFYLYKIL